MIHNFLRDSYTIKKISFCSCWIGFLSFILIKGRITAWSTWRLQGLSRTGIFSLSPLIMIMTAMMMGLMCLRKWTNRSFPCWDFKTRFSFNTLRDNKRKFLQFLRHKLTSNCWIFFRGGEKSHADACLSRLNHRPTLCFKSQTKTFRFDIDLRMQGF